MNATLSQPRSAPRSLSRDLRNSCPVPRPPLPVSRARERGSILVLCIGMIAIMAVMAAALLTQVAMHRDSATNVHFHNLGKAVTLSGKAHALAALDASAGDAMTTLGGRWNAAFEAVSTNGRNDYDIRLPDGTVTSIADSGAGGDTACTDLWAFTGYGDPYPDDDRHNGWGAWIYLDPPDPGFDHIRDATLGYRYAVNVIDLNGRWLVNPSAAMVTDGGEADFAAMLKAQMKHCGDDSIGSQAATLVQSVFGQSGTSTMDGGGDIVPANTNAISWSQLEAATAMGGKWSLMVTPYGDTGITADGGSPGGTYIGWRVNVMTAPRGLLDAMVFGLCSDLNADANGYTPPGCEDADLVTAGDDFTGTVAGESHDVGFLNGSDGDTFTHIYGADSGSVDDADYMYDIAAALCTVVNGIRSGHADYAHIDSAKSFQYMFEQELDARYDITGVWNSGWQLDAGPPKAWTKVGGTPTRFAKAAAMEKAVNDVLQNFFTGEDGAFDGTDTDSDGEADYGRFGIYAYDWDGSECDLNDGASASTLMDGADQRQWGDDWTLNGLAGQNDQWNRPAPGAGGATTPNFHSPEALDTFADDGSYNYSWTKRFEEGEASNTESPSVTWTGSWFFGRSRFFRVIVRGQVINYANDKVVAESNLEFVYVVDPNGDGKLGDNQILYQRWVAE